MQILCIWRTSIDNSSVGFLDFSKQSFDFSLIQLSEELALVCNSCTGRKYLYCYYDCCVFCLIAYLIILELLAMNPSVDTLHIQWITQILCNWGTSIDHSSVGFINFSKQNFGFSLIQFSEGLALACNIYLAANYLYCYFDCCLLCLIADLIILVLATVNTLVSHPPNLVDNRDPLYLVDQH